MTQNAGDGFSWGGALPFPIGATIDGSTLSWPKCASVFCLQVAQVASNSWRPLESIACSEYEHRH
jgi:hypothetical protein